LVLNPLKEEWLLPRSASFSDRVFGCGRFLCSQPEDRFHDGASDSFGDTVRRLRLRCDVLDRDAAFEDALDAHTCEDDGSNRNAHGLRGPANFTDGAPVLGRALASFAEFTQCAVPDFTERAIQKMIARKKWQHGSSPFFHPASRSH
jgi:hypothetical protein